MKETCSVCHCALCPVEISAQQINVVIDILAVKTNKKSRKVVAEVTIKFSGCLCVCSKGDSVLNWSSSCLFFSDLLFC